VEVESLVNEELIDALELIVFAAVGLTAAALSQSALTDLTVIQWRALVIIGRAKSLRVGEVATHLGASLTATSRLIRRLEGRGYITSSRDEADRRATLVRLTDVGREVRAEVMSRRRKLMADALEKLPGSLPEGTAAGLRQLATGLADYS
jgi:DNA-binding MarR family transcriptional regulator